jgi:hypothetical protein
MPKPVRRNARVVGRSVGDILMADDPRPDKGSGGVLRSGLIPWLGFFLLVFGVAGMVIYIVGPAG